MRCFIAGMLLFFAGCVGDERLNVPDPAIETCRDWLRNNLDDPHWDEVEWEKPIEDIGRTHYHMKIRTRSPEGGKVLKRFIFLINHDDGKIFHAREIEND